MSQNLYCILQEKDSFESFYHHDGTSIYRKTSNGSDGSNGSAIIVIRWLFSCNALIRWKVLAFGKIRSGAIKNVSFFSWKTD